MKSTTRITEAGLAGELQYRRGRAAARVHVAQPGLGQQIKALEAELGVRLLIRADMPGQVEIRSHDVTSDEIPTSAYDVIHARLVPGHLPQRDAIIPPLVSALATGG